MISLVIRAVRPERLRRAGKWSEALLSTNYSSPFFSQSASSSSQVVRFKGLSFGYDDRNKLLDTVDFSLQEGSKVTIMGQNGSGKSTIIKLLSKHIYPDEGQVIVKPGARVACAMQTMPTACRELTVKSFFAGQLGDASLANHELEAKMAKALNDVLLEAPGDRIVKTFSGGQQARLLLAAALIRNPTVLLLDEPTNNLDPDGLWHLQSLIQNTDKTCVVISHDEDFLNSFTDQVLYLDVFSKKVETYNGDYYFVKEEIVQRIKRENAENALLMKTAQAKKDQANKFANKGGGLRKVAQTMRGVAAEMEAKMVDVRREDVALRDFILPFSCSSSSGKLLSIHQVSAYQKAAKIQSGPVHLMRGSRVQVRGPNGIGKTTFLEMIVAGTAPGVTIADGASIGYYRQDFHNFDFDATVLTCLEQASNRKHTVEETRKIAAAFLLRGRTVTQQVKTLSEGQKGLLSLACLYLQQPSILIMDEPTNHINFRHLRALAKGVRSFKGAVLLVSHDSHFVDDVGVSSVIDMGKEFGDLKKMAA
jgi:ATPase subunit of ABC transporter with duplicated ATPase domains